MASEAQIRANERAKCAAEIRAMNAEHIGYEWVRGSIWHNIIERAAQTIELGLRTTGEAVAGEQSKIGTAAQAITFALDYIEDHYDRLEFLKDWRDGSVASEPAWADYRRWLKAQRTETVNAG